MIALEKVTKDFPGRQRVRALDEIDLSVGSGELVSIVGPSGSGKSTLLNIVGALDRPSSGLVFIDGQPIPDTDDAGLALVRRDKIGFVFQFFNLLPTLSCLDNVALPLHLRGWTRRRARDQAAYVLGKVGLSERIWHTPDELSGGQRQRVAIARALAGSPPVLLADEPTGNLDSRTGEEILELIRALHADLGATILLVTHDPSVAARCQRTITIRDGRIVEDVRR